MTPSDALEWRADGHIIIVGGVLQASCADDADAWTLARWHNEVAAALRDARAETAELRARIEAVIARARVEHVASDIAPFVFVDELVAALFPAEEQR